MFSSIKKLNKLQLKTNKINLLQNTCINPYNPTSNTKLKNRKMIINIYMYNTIKYIRALIFLVLTLISIFKLHKLFLSPVTPAKNNRLFHWALTATVNITLFLTSLISWSYHTSSLTSIPFLHTIFTLINSFHILIPFILTISIINAIKVTFYFNYINNEKNKDKRKYHNVSFSILTPLDLVYPYIFILFSSFFPRFTLPFNIYHNNSQDKENCK